MNTRKKLENDKVQQNSQIELDAAWSGYDSPYVQNILKIALKSLKMLSVLTFDAALMMWTKGLEGHLLKRMKEAEAQRIKDLSYKFKI